MINEKDAKTIQAAIKARNCQEFLDDIFAKKTRENISNLGHESRKDNPCQLRINLLVANLVGMDDIKNEIQNKIKKAQRLEKEVLNGGPN